jgi:hypothetical protein
MEFQFVKFEVRQCPHCQDSGDAIWMTWHGKWPWADRILFAPFRNVLRFLIGIGIIEPPR